MERVSKGRVLRGYQGRALRKEMKKVKGSCVTFCHDNIFKVFRARREGSCSSGPVPSFYRRGIVGH